MSAVEPSGDGFPLAEHAAVRARFNEFPQKVPEGSVKGQSAACPLGEEVASARRLETAACGARTPARFDRRPIHKGVLQKRKGRPREWEPTLSVFRRALSGAARRGSPEKLVPACAIPREFGHRCILREKSRSNPNPLSVRFFPQSRSPRCLHSPCTPGTTLAPCEPSASAKGTQLVLALSSYA